VLVFIPQVGLTINGSHSWLSIFGFTFQPAELAKVATVVILAALLGGQKRDWHDWQTQLLPIMLVAALPLFLILLQGDLGSATIVGVITLVMLYVARVPGRYLGILLLAAVIGGAIMIVAAPHRVNRILLFINPDLVTNERFRYQIDQASLAIGSGGVWGLGFGHSRQKFQYLPEVNADSIFAIFAEENGLIGGALFLTLLLLIGWRGLKIAAHMPDDLGRLLVTGVITWFMWQSFLNIGGIVRALPLTGVPLPLVSHGGSAYMTMLAALGIVVGASRFELITESKEH
jgi:cell division protein FtsW